MVFLTLILKLGIFMCIGYGVWELFHWLCSDRSLLGDEDGEDNDTTS